MLPIFKASRLINLQRERIANWGKAQNNWMIRERSGVETIGGRASMSAALLTAV